MLRPHANVLKSGGAQADVLLSLIESIAEHDPQDILRLVDTLSHGEARPDNGFDAAMDLTRFFIDQRVNELVESAIITGMI